MTIQACSNLYQSILNEYGLKEESVEVQVFGSGLINSTWKVTTPEREYILQRINDTVFNQPEDIANNVSLIACYLKEQHPDYTFVGPITSENGKQMIYEEGEGFFRIYPFVAGSHSKNAVETPNQAYEAARQFGKFTRLLAGMDSVNLTITIPFFHDISLRYKQFLTSIDNGNKSRLREARCLVQTLLSYTDIISEYERITRDTEFKKRVTHHDTKISNVLFNENEKAICVIDLDTVMPGYFISDVGDMMRTYLSPTTEEEKDFSLIAIRDEFYKAIVKGYCQEMKNELTPSESKYFFYSGKFMIYMQALRFLTDHLNNDIYYGAKYPGHNYVRAANQAKLLEKLIEKEVLLASYQGEEPDDLNQ